MDTNENNKKERGIRRIINAFRYSFAGYKAAWKNEEAFRQECIVAIFVIPIGLWLGRTMTQRALLIGVYLIIPLIELLNASIEAIVDRMGPERHLLSGRAKDLGSAAVLLSICMAIIVWVFIAYERFFS
ncbi:MAG: diacylglycerol kinase [Deltaproteobacteria bacterium RBG_19FT_COMBO_46_9]|nr:MAG: diacylglycerol kinase [Deltaproteobacteria bacterium RBG_19FT_COMBO_46_9]